MLSGFKGKAPEKDQSAAGAGPPGFLTAGAPLQRLPVAPPPTRPVLSAKPEATARAELTSKPVAKPDALSSIGPTMSVVGQVVCTGQARVFGRVEGELRVSDLLIGEGGHVEGTVIAQEVTVRGHVKGTIRALRVRLEDGATVEGDIFHRSLLVEEGALFEGSSRRVENPTEAPVDFPEAVAEQPAAAKVVQPQVAQPHAASGDADLAAKPSAEMART
jgi:cytoskeletal protein CcmA (bactofilin family)